MVEKHSFPNVQLQPELLEPFIQAEIEKEFSLQEDGRTYVKATESIPGQSERHS